MMGLCGFVFVLNDSVFFASPHRLDVHSKFGTMSPRAPATVIVTKMILLAVVVTSSRLIGSAHPFPFRQSRPIGNCSVTRAVSPALSVICLVNDTSGKAKRKAPLPFASFLQVSFFVQNHVPVCLSLCFWFPFRQSLSLVWPRELAQRFLLERAPARNGK